MTYLNGITGQGGGGAECPWHFSPGNFCWPTGKKGARKKRKTERKKENLNRKRWKIENGRGKGMNMSRRLFFFACHFLFGVYQNGQFLPGKSYFTGKLPGENWLCPLWKIFLLRHFNILVHLYMHTSVSSEPVVLPRRFSCEFCDSHVVHHSNMKFIQIVLLWQIQQWSPIPQLRWNGMQHVNRKLSINYG